MKHKIRPALPIACTITIVTSSYELLDVKQFATRIRQYIFFINKRMANHNTHTYTQMARKRKKIDASSIFKWM